MAQNPRDIVGSCRKAAEVEGGLQSGPAVGSFTCQDLREVRMVEGEELSTWEVEEGVPVRLA